MKNVLMLIMVLSFGVCPLLSLAQNYKSDSSYGDLKIKTDKAFKKVNHVLVNDSVSLYSFFFKIQIIKTEKKQSKVTKISVNDSLAYSLFPFFNDLYSINYNVLLKNKNQVNLIIPVLLYIESAKKRKFSSQNECSLIDMMSIIDEYNNAFSALLSDNHILLEDVVLFKPYVIPVYGLVH